MSELSMQSRIQAMLLSKAAEIAKHVDSTVQEVLEDPEVYHSGAFADYHVRKRFEAYTEREEIARLTNEFVESH